MRTVLNMHKFLSTYILQNVRARIVAISLALSRKQQYSQSLVPGKAINRRNAKT